MERRSAGLFAAVVAVATVFGTLPAAHAADPPVPTIRLFAATSSITVQRNGRYAYIDPGTWIESVNGAFQLNVSRPDYDTLVGISQVDPTTGAVLRTLPATVLDGQYGLSDFSHLSIRDDAGKLITRFGQSFCPDMYDVQRVNDSGPVTSRYPELLLL